MQETQVQSLRWEDPLVKGMATHSSILAWRTSWTEELVDYSPRSCRVRHDWEANIFTFNVPANWQQPSEVKLVVTVQSLSHFRLFVTPGAAVRQAPPSSTISWGLLGFMSIESVILPNHLILCRPLLLLPSVFPSIRVFSSESALCIRWPKYWDFSFHISPSNKYSGLASET